LPRAFCGPQWRSIASYSASLVRSRSSVPAITIKRCSLATAELLADRGHVRGLHVRPVVMVDRDDGGPAAAAEAFDRAQRHLAVVGGLPRPDAELLLEALEHLLRADECARDVRAHLDHVPAGRREVKHVVERRDRLAERRRRTERIGALAQSLGREVAVLLLREPQGRQSRRAPVRILRLDLLNFLVVRAHRSTSPMTVSSEPTIAIMSATSASRMHVAVASSATNEGARNFTRHGFGPPSETT